MSWRGNAAVGIAALGIALVAVIASALARAQTSADLILVNGTVITVDAADSIAQGVAVSGGKIVAVGASRDMRALANGRTQVIDLHGRTVTPGLIDTHVHFSETADLFSINLSDVAITKIDDVVKRVAERVATAKGGEWIRGSGWDEGKLAERRYVLASDLDKVAPNNPVWLEHTTGHYGVANSYALKLAEVRKVTPDPPAGTIDRDVQGNPTGVMKEAA
ncbi:MAG: amidohydrolase, partial [Acidobacteria bacterium]